MTEDKLLDYLYSLYRRNAANAARPRVPQYGLNIIYAKQEQLSEIICKLRGWKYDENLGNDKVAKDPRASAA